MSWRVPARRIPTRRVGFIGLLAVTVGLLGGMPTAQATDQPMTAVTVRVAPGVSASTVISSFGGSVTETYPTFDAVGASLPTVNVDALRGSPGVVEVTTDAAPNSAPSTESVAGSRSNLGFVESDHAHAEGGTAYAGLNLQALAQVVGAQRAWRETTGTGVDVALIDTGIAPVAGVGTVVNGPDLSFDGANPSYTSLDAYGHGTHLAGIINGDTSAAPGLAPGARIVNVRVGAADGAVDVSQVIAALDWVVSHRADNGMNIRVVVLAYGTDGTQSYEVDPLAAAVENAWHHGIVVVAAAGNRGSAATSLDDPAIDPYVIAVGATETNGTFTTADDTVAPFNNTPGSTRGVDLVAPGRSIVSLRVPGSFVDVAHAEGRVGTLQFRGSGSSQAAAVVGAAAALIVADRPDLSPDQVKAILLRTARSLPRVAAAVQGAGVVDFDEAVRRNPPSASEADQSWPLATGTGSLELARGSYHVLDPTGTAVVGERTVWNGQSWSGQSWSGQSWSGQSWSGGSWSGQSWSGQSWSGGTWLGQSWSGQSWSGQSWSGQSWSGQSWSGQSWSGQSWSGQSWSGQSWSGQSWSGQSWSGV